MKNLVDCINESINNKWVYLCCLLGKKLNFFRNNNWNPHNESEFVKDKLVMVKTDKNLNVDQEPIIKAFRKKYGEVTETPYILLYSYGKEENEKIIKKIIDAYDNGKITFKDIISVDSKSNNIKPENKAEFFATELNI